MSVVRRLENLCEIEQGGRGRFLQQPDREQAHNSNLYRASHLDIPQNDHGYDHMEDVPDDIRRLLCVVGALAHRPGEGVGRALHTAQREDKRGHRVKDSAGDDVDDQNPAYGAVYALDEA